MSDKLWIPGQTEPAVSQELILPGGQSADPAPPSAPNAPAAPAPPEAPAARQDPDPAAAEEQAQRFRKFIESLKYPPRPVQVACPQCRAQVNSLVFPIQDYGANPQLLSMFLSGQLDTLMCAGCGNSLTLGFPVMVHWPQQEFLGVVVPESGNAQATPQTLIGQLSATFMAKVPPPERKGYMLNPKQYLSRARLHDTLWEFQGVTREMRQRQQAQMILLQRMLTAQGQADDWQRLVEADASLVDRGFMLQIMQMAQQAPAEADGSPELRALLQFLLERTAAGQQVQAQQQAIADITRKMQDGVAVQDLVHLLSAQWHQEGGSDVVLALVHTAPHRFDYEFLLELSLLIDTEEEDRRRKALEEMRSGIDAAMKAVVQQRAQLQQNVYQASVSLISGALEAEDPAALLRGQPRLLRGPFMPVLMNMIGNAERNKAQEVVQRLLHLRDVALQVQTETMGPEDCFLFQLITAKSVREERSLMEKEHALITQELLDKMNELATGLQENDMMEQARKIRSLRGQLALMR